MFHLSVVMSWRQRLVERNNHATPQLGGSVTEPHLELVKIKDFEAYRNDKFKRTTYEGIFQINHNLGELPGNILRFGSAIDEMYLNLVTKVTEWASESDYVSCTLASNDLDYDIFICPRRIDKIQGSDFLNAVAEVANSRLNFLLSGSFNVTFTVVRNPNLIGAGFKRALAPETCVSSSKRKRSVVAIKNTDNLCMLRAIIVAQSAATGDSNWQKKYCLERKRFYQKLAQNGPANIREALFGGRCNNLQFLVEAKEDEELKYLDVTSLYPYVMRKKYPLHHPRVINEDFDFSLTNYLGFVKCSITPPRGLYLPVLPLTIGKRLVFTLCRTCAESQNQASCTHTVSERQLTNTWTTIELQDALKHGYVINEIYQVLDYRQDGNEPIFTRYIDMWYKIEDN